MLETERLELVPLPARQLGLWIDALPALERELRCVYRAEPMTGLFLEIVKGQYAATLADPANYPWHSFWFLIRKSDRTVVGSADFKDVPGAGGEVELGYGLGRDFRRQGYMTEAVRALCAWALAQPGVKCVLAETEPDGYASQRILRRCGFAEIARNTTLWWRLDR